MTEHGSRLCMFRVPNPTGVSQSNRRCVRDNCEAWIDDASCCSVTLLGEVLLYVLRGFGSGNKRVSGEGPVHDV